MRVVNSSNSSGDPYVDPASAVNWACPLYPFRFVPVYKEKIWGGDALARLFGRRLPSRRVGESWEVAAHPHGESVIENGPLAGVSLVELLARRPHEIMGRTPLLSGRFPLLVKLLDCNDWLSVQVHPDDEYARSHEGDLGKQESWVVLWAAPEAQIVYGLQPGTTREQFAAAIAAGRVEDVLNKVNVRAGDVFSVPPGTVHALGRGVVVAEIQQNSDTVYRVYDWNRLGDDGKPRELHVSKALDVIRFAASAACASPSPSSSPLPSPSSLPRTASSSLPRPSSSSWPAPGVRLVRLDANSRYVIERVELGAAWRPEPDDRFFVYMLVGSGPVACDLADAEQELTLRLGDTVLVPAAVAASGRLVFRPAAAEDEAGGRPKAKEARAEAQGDGGGQTAAGVDQGQAGSGLAGQPRAVFLRAYVPDPR